MRYAVLILLLSSLARAADYSSTITVVETDAIRITSDGTRTTTDCSAYVPNQLDCTSVTSTTASIQLVQLIKASDGKTYAVACVDSARRRFAQGFAAGSGATSVSGCRIPNGDYKARWDNGVLVIAHDKHGKKRETKFYVVTRVTPPLTPSASVPQQ